MRWLLVLTLAVCGYLGAAHFSGGALHTLGLPLGGERGYLREVALRFVEDIKFKDFQSAAQYHAPEVRDEVDIPFLIQRLFLTKPESLEILESEIVFSELDSTGVRARVKCRVKAKHLGNGSIRDQEFMLFFYRKSQTDPWYMELESSLRSREAQKGKKH